MIFFSQIQKEKHKKPFCFLKTESLKNKVHGMSSPKSNINRPTGPNSHLSTSANTQHLARILISLSLSLCNQLALFWSKYYLKHGNTPLSLPEILQKCQ